MVGFFPLHQGWDLELLSLLSGDWEKDVCVCVCVMKTGGEAGRTPPPVTRPPRSCESESSEGSTGSLSTCQQTVRASCGDFWC